MESYWCSQKNSDVNLNDGTIPDLALIPCRKSECVVWRNGEGSHIRKVGKPECPQVSSKDERPSYLRSVGKYLV
jgi:hypothetical protein